MKKEICISAAKLIYTKDELGYQEVLDQMSNAARIVILTFNISEKHNELFKCLRTAANNAEISIITNIPSRWNEYYGDKYRQAAQPKINVYLTKLKPEDIGKHVNVFFNFDNHGKIVMTDKIVYIGSSNFPEESKDNIEFGIISYDPSLIEFLLDELIPDITRDSLNYYEYDYMPLLLEAEMNWSALDRMIRVLHDQVYFLFDGRNCECFYYNNIDDSLTQETCDAVIGIVDHSMSICSDIVEVIKEMDNEDEGLLSCINNIEGELRQLGSIIEQDLLSDVIIDLARFSINKHIDDLLQTEYAMTAYEENLDDCIKKAQQDAMNVHMEFANEAEDRLENILTNLSKFCHQFCESVICFKKLELKKRNAEIDNT